MEIKSLETRVGYKTVDILKQEIDNHLYVMGPAYIQTDAGQHYLRVANQYDLYLRDLYVPSNR